ncbi:ubiquitin-conjugating enzyme E2 27 [Tanacetum coccineum]
MDSISRSKASKFPEQLDPLHLATGGKFPASQRCNEYARWHDYPFSPPKMRFTTKVWHPNISSQTGAFGLLKSDWSFAITLRSALICLQILLSVPEPKEPQDAVIAKQCLLFPPLQYLTDHAAFTDTVRRWTEEFSMVSSAVYNRKGLCPLDLVRGCRPLDPATRGAAPGPP